ncbi:MAG: hypothetical protein JW932_06555 [Deltaproteobacteria bacterium]|nr:hypothetical protein [Deltaproteobacteria bacterium]
MSKKRKKYEPPTIKEIGGVFEQAMGLSCVVGSIFSDCPGGGPFRAGTCPGGPAPTLGCPGGNPDRPVVCRTGGGPFTAMVCRGGPGAG